MESPSNNQVPPSNTIEHQIDPKLNDEESTKELTLQAVDLNLGTSSSDPATPFTIASAIPSGDKSQETKNPPGPQIPLIFITAPSCTQAISNLAITTQPQSGCSNFLRLQSPRSIAHLSENQPHSLFIQALSKLNESQISFAVIDNLRATNSNNDGTARISNINPKSPDDDSLKTPDSLTSAPPSYSFVIRQMSARRRPRLMGTFIPSPSFVNHTPPPNYATAFDLYVENPLPPQPSIRPEFDLGFVSRPAICHECGYTGMTVVVSKVTMCTHLCAVFMCVFCCWICAPLAYFTGTCKDVRHYCRNCGHYLGMYSPTNPEANVYPAPTGTR